MLSLPRTSVSSQHTVITLTKSCFPCTLSPYCHAITGYIGEFEIIDDHRAQKIVVELNGRLNKCGVISPLVLIYLRVDKALERSTIPNTYLEVWYS